MLPITTGVGIGLQSRPQSYIPTAIGQLRQAQKEAAFAEQEARKARAKDISDLEKYQDDTHKWLVDKQSGLLPIDQEIAKAKAQAIINLIKPGETVDKTKIYEAQLDLNKFVDNAKSSAKNLLQQGQTGIEHPDKFNVKQEIVDLANSPGTPENYAKWQQLTGGTGYYMSGLLDPIDKTDWLEDLQKNVIGSGLKYQSVVDPVTGKRMGLQAPKNEQINNVWEQAKTQSWYPRALSQKVSLGIDPADAEVQIKQTFITAIPKDVSLRGMEEKAGGAGEVLTKADIKTQVPVNIIEGKTGGKVEDVAHYGLTLPANVTLNIPASKNIIDRSTGKAFDYTGQLNISGGEILSSKINGKFVPMLYATVPTKEYGTTTYSDIEIPLEEIRGQRTLEKHKEAVDEIQRLTNELNQPPKTTAPKTEKWNKYKR